MGQNHRLIELKTVDSTNLYAERLLKQQKVPEGTLVFSQEQTSGKGQGENRWESEAGKNCTFSMILFPGFLAPEKQFMLNKAITLGVLDFLDSMQVTQKFQIKWPNDLYADHSKIGGILIQNVICGNVYESCIVGIGVNINQEKFHAGLPNPISLKQMIGFDYPVMEALNKIAEHIDQRYNMLKSSFVELNQEYLSRILWVNTLQDFRVDKKDIKGKILDVEETGLLKVEMEDNSIKYFSHGEIDFLIP